MSEDVMQIPWLEIQTPLPPAAAAQPQNASLAGLVAAGGGLSVPRLVEAYNSGIYPWYSEGQPVLWWSPDPRMVLHVNEFKLHRSLRKTLQKFTATQGCEIKFDRVFERVIRHCATHERSGQPGTWIVEDMIQAYVALHHAGFAHSVETWKDGELIGGLYCVSIGQAVFGESMFALETDASKIALSALVAFGRHNNIKCIDCQQNTRHLASLGAREIARADFVEITHTSAKQNAMNWTFTPDHWNHLLQKAPAP
jgi:leucyl/phenylalanyl-tRNA---protein transferase